MYLENNMPEKAVDTIVDLLNDNLPTELKQIPQFLLWKFEQKPNRSKPIKVPYYVNGSRRAGSLDTEKDLSQLAKYEEALIAYEVGDFDGIGFAVTGQGIGAFDLDYCLDPETKEIDRDHAGYKIAQEAKDLGCYIEITPSGQGLRFIGPCDDSKAYSKGGLEFWGKGRYVTLTGQTYANPKGWKDISDLRSSLSDNLPDNVVKMNPEDIILTPVLLDEITSALSKIPGDDEGEWFQITNALKHLEMASGSPKVSILWDQWSKKSPKYNKAGNLERWEKLKPNGSLTYKTIFSRATEYGWINPKKGVKGDSEDSKAIDLNEWRYELTENLKPTEYAIDGFLTVGINLLAGAWGAGKTTNLIPLLASAARLTPYEWGFNNELRRKIIWFSEDANQVNMTLRSMSEEPGAADMTTIKEWFIAYNSRRLPPSDLIPSVLKLAREHITEAPNGFKIKPLIVFDTTSANFQLENESDNSEVSSAMAIIKQTLMDYPVVLVGHTPKALKKGEITDLTFRGASAWEADAHATYFMAEEEGERYLILGKRRFVPKFTEITFGSGSYTEAVPTPWDSVQHPVAMHGIPQISSTAERLEKKEKAKEQKSLEIELKRKTELQETILQFVRDNIMESDLMTKAHIDNSITGKRELIIGAIKNLVDSGELKEYEFRPKGQRGQMPIIVIPKEVDFDIYTGRFNKN
jgi:hypothetical protein